MFGGDMKKTLLILVAILLISSNSYAHGGRTDENGGHTDHSTGEYHYHHGYAAHDHYDMDGDGDLDCPKTFQTEHRSAKRDSIESSYSFDWYFLLRRITTISAIGLMVISLFAFIGGFISNKPKWVIDLWFYLLTFLAASVPFGMLGWIVYSSFVVGCREVVISIAVLSAATSLMIVGNLTGMFKKRNPPN